MESLIWSRSNPESQNSVRRLGETVFYIQILVEMLRLLSLNKLDCSHLQDLLIFRLKVCHIGKRWFIFQNLSFVKVLGLIKILLQVNYYFY